jgi:hypothetical protein
MAFPVPANTTCCVWRFGSYSPAAPALTGIPCYLQGDFMRRMETGESEVVSLRYSHVMLVDVAADVRDGSHNYGFSNGDQVGVPDPHGTLFLVRWVEVHNRGSPQAHRRVYLDRQTPTWPTTNL